MIADGNSAPPVRAAKGQPPQLTVPGWLDDLGLPANEFRILCHLARRAGPKGFCHPSVRTIAAKCRLHKDTVARGIKALESKGLVRRYYRGSGTSNGYDLIYCGLARTGVLERKGANLTERKGRHLPESKGDKGVDWKGESREGEADTTPPNLPREPEWLQEVAAKSGLDVQQVRDEWAHFRGAKLNFPKDVAGKSAEDVRQMFLAKLPRSSPKTRRPAPAPPPTGPEGWQEILRANPHLVGPDDESPVESALCLNRWHVVPGPIRRQIEALMGRGHEQSGSD